MKWIFNFKKQQCNIYHIYLLLLLEIIIFLEYRTFPYLLNHFPFIILHGKYLQIQHVGNFDSIFRNRQIINSVTIVSWLDGEKCDATPHDCGAIIRLRVFSPAAMARAPQHQTALDLISWTIPWTGSRGI